MRLVAAGNLNGSGVPLVSRGRAKEGCLLPCGLYIDLPANSSEAQYQRAQPHSTGRDREHRSLPCLPFAARPLEPCRPPHLLHILSKTAEPEPAILQQRPFTATTPP